MDPTQKKCLIGSVASHALLVAVIAFAPAFIKKEIEQPTEPLDFIPSRVVDVLLEKPGAPSAKVVEAKVTPPRPAPPPPKPQPRPTPQPEPVKKPEPKPEPPKQVKKPDPPKKKPEPKKVEPKKVTPKPVTKKPDPPKKKVVKKTTPKPPPKKAPPKIKVNINAVTTKTSSVSKAEQQRRERARQQAEAKRKAEAAAKLAMLKDNEKAWQKTRMDQQKLAKATSDSVSRIRTGLQPSMTIDTSKGSGAAYATYAQYVRTIYDAALRKQGAQEGRPGELIKVRITIARSGRVTEERIISGSRTSSYGRAVQQALNWVDQIRPFGPGTTDSSRTYIINFRL